MSDPARVAVFTIPSHRSFADALAAGLIARFGKEPLGLAQGRILLPNNRAVRAVTEAFVRASGSGLLLPRLIPIGDPEIDERVGGALDRDRWGARAAGDRPDRATAAAGVDRAGRRARPKACGWRPTSRGRSTRCWSRRSRRQSSATRSPRRASWRAIGRSRSTKLELIYEAWPQILRRAGSIDLAERRNRLLRALAERWERRAAGGLHCRRGHHDRGAGSRGGGRARRADAGRHGRAARAVARDVFPEEEWDALGPDEHGPRRGRRIRNSI